MSPFAEGSHTLTKKHLLAAVNDSGFSKLAPAKGPSGRLLWLSGIAVLLLLAIAYAVVQSQFFSGLQLNWAQYDVTELPLEVEKQLNLSQQNTQVDKVAELPVQQQITDQVILKPAVDEPGEAQRLKNLKVIKTSKVEVKLLEQKVLTESKKNKQSAANLGIVNNVQVEQSQQLEGLSSSKKYENYQQWLDAKIESSKQWLKNADKQSVSIQVLMRSKSAGRDLVSFLNNEWPLELDKTYLYEVNMKGKAIYRVFYGEYPSITLGQIKMKQLPESVRVNSPYLHSVYRMQKALL